MVSSLEKRYLSSAGLSPLRTHSIASLKMSGKTITYSGCCHPLSPDSSTITQPKISTVCLSISKRVRKISSITPSENTEFMKDMELSSFKKKEKERKKKYP